MSPKLLESVPLGLGRAGRTLPVPVPLFAERPPKVKNQGGRVGWVEPEDAPPAKFPMTAVPLSVRSKTLGGACLGDQGL